MAVASTTNKLASRLNGECLVGIWKRDALRSLVWHTAAPCSRRDNLVFPSWSWYSVKGPVVYSAYTPFNAEVQRTQSGHSLKNDMINSHKAKVLEISCQQDRNNMNVYRGCVKLRELTLRAYFASGENRVLF